MAVPPRSICVSHRCLAGPGGQHFGSRLLWLPNQTLLVSIGDGGNPPVRLQGDWIRKQAQNPRSHLG